MKKNTPEEDNYLISIGLRIKENRKKKSFTQGDLAQMIGTSQPQVARIEAGEQKSALIAYKRIAAVLDIAIEDLLKE